ncbi:MAG: hypothetical protein LH679_16845 [Cyanobacteria bacterium CAN_BIN43]|jgi:hypothetical protein|nr:hypothetical protein [Cyanobacteria bacterium CAN_BIN43]
MTATFEPKTTFNPLRSVPGEFRVALCLTNLGEKALDVLKLAESLEFEAPKFTSDSSGNVWAIVLQQFHRYDSDPMVVVEPWDQQMSELWQACEPDAGANILISNNFEAYRHIAA